MKKFMSVVVAILMVFGIFAGTTKVFAANDNVPSSYEQGSSLITGVIDLSRSVKSEGSEVTKDGKLYYEGIVSGSVEASDLFEGAYEKYIADIKGKSTGGKQWDHLVMFDKGQKFPTARFTVYLPNNFEVNSDEITFSENTVMVSKIEKSYNPANNSVTFTFNLGNWNDYKGFFELYEKEKGETGHSITINIPYSVEIKDSSVSNLGTISSDGKCELYKKVLFWEQKIVDITATKLNLDVIR
ncbi:hypothetical protein [Peptostreptococcus porci]|uniref:hypothetical protein n=1 Tax=Peptostreptococcus porci TaxID=2652282 RepID=UPI0023F3E10D|nr:hypothetical protein [Peptostreptococcus porci]MDD7182126.1 hypothetical protein [Peptostreptococcus porci]